MIVLSDSLFSFFLFLLFSLWLSPSRFGIRQSTRRTSRWKQWTANCSVVPCMCVSVFFFHFFYFICHLSLSKLDFKKGRSRKSTLLLYIPIGLNGTRFFSCSQMINTYVYFTRVRSFFFFFFFLFFFFSEFLEQYQTTLVSTSFRVIWYIFLLLFLRGQEGLRN